MIKLEQLDIDNLISAINNRAKKINATATVAGLMSTADKSKLDGIATSANSYTLPVASSITLGGIYASLSGSNLTLDF